MAANVKTFKYLLLFVSAVSIFWTCNHFISRLHVDSDLRSIKKIAETVKSVYSNNSSYSDINKWWSVQQIARSELESGATMDLRSEGAAQTFDVVLKNVPNCLDYSDAAKIALIDGLIESHCSRDELVITFK